ncbi:MAG: hypothetical protein V1706_15800 [Pseudomonadota bacterium]
MAKKNYIFPQFLLFRNDKVVPLSLRLLGSMKKRYKIFRWYDLLAKNNDIEVHSPDWRQDDVHSPVSPNWSTEWGETHLC